MDLRWISIYKTMGLKNKIVRISTLIKNMKYL